MPALPLGEGGKYVVAAYVVFVALICIYVAIISRKVARAERRLDEISQHARTRRR
jgi:hypothetical protein